MKDDTAADIRQARLDVEDLLRIAEQRPDLADVLATLITAAIDVLTALLELVAGTARKLTR